MRTFEVTWFRPLNQFLEQRSSYWYLTCSLDKSLATKLGYCEEKLKEMIDVVLIYLTLVYETLKFTTVDLDGAHITANVGIEQIVKNRIQDALYLTLFVTLLWIERGRTVDKTADCIASKFRRCAEDKGRHSSTYPRL